jgi:membrane fusion protein (multidrug efflux system)
VKLGLSAGDLPFSGRIKGIDPRIDPASRLVNVRAEVANPEGRLTPGQFVQVRVELPKEDGVMALPQTALTTSLYGDYVFVVRPAKANASAGKPADTTKPADAKPEEKPAEAKPAESGQKQDLVLAQIFVRPGRRNDGLVEILSGVVAGDEVVTAGQNRLFNGMPVVVDNTIDPTKSLKPEAGQP